jgi:hypothetical protein
MRFGRRDIIYKYARKVFAPVMMHARVAARKRAGTTAARATVGSKRDTP